MGGSASTLLFTTALLWYDIIKVEWVEFLEVFKIWVEFLKVFGNWQNSSGTFKNYIFFYL